MLDSRKKPTVQSSEGSSLLRESLPVRRGVAEGNAQKISLLDEAELLKKEELQRKRAKETSKKPVLLLLDKIIELRGTGTFGLLVNESNDLLARIEQLAAIPYEEDAVLDLSSTPTVDQLIFTMQAYIKDEACNLTSLNLYNTKITIKGVFALADAVKCNTSLNFVKLSEINVFNIYQLLEREHQLTKQLDFCGANLIPLDLAFLGSLLKANSTIEELNLEGTILTEKKSSLCVLELICEALCCHQSLKKVSFQKTTLDADGLANVSSIIENSKTLLEVDLSFNRVITNPSTECTYHGMKILSESLRRNSTICTLHLQGNRLDCDSIYLLSKILKGSSSLTYLDLSSNPLYCAGIICLSQALKENDTLETMNLSNTNFGNDGLLALSECLKTRNFHLTSLNLQENPSVTKRAIRALREALEDNYSIVSLEMPIRGQCKREGEKIKLILQSNRDLGEVRKNPVGFNFADLPHFSLCLILRKMKYFQQLEREKLLSNRSFQDIQINSDSLDGKVSPIEFFANSHSLEITRNLIAVYSAQSKKTCFESRKAVINEDENDWDNIHFGLGSKH